jgi:mannose-6-phosphate isomerase-like protein (cupin superfamily)
MDDAIVGTAVRRAVPLVRVATAAATLLAALAMLACTRSPEPQPPEPQADAPRHVRNRFFVREDSAVAKVEPAPPGELGQSTAYRYFDDVTDARVIFRKRALHRGSAIGMHVLTHDEVYYVVSGRGRLRVDDREVEVGPNTAMFMHEGADVGIWQEGDDELVLIVAYPPAAK